MERLTSALGPPQALREVVEDGALLGAVGRWRHEGARVDLSGTDTVQVIFNVSGGQQVKRHTPAGSSHRIVRAGSIGIITPGPYAQVAIRGGADTVQIVLGRELLASAATRLAALPDRRVMGAPGSLQAAAVQMMVKLAQGLLDGGDTLATLLRQIAECLVVPVARRQRGFAIGGLSPAARRRTAALMDARLQSGWCAPLALDELARAAGLSLHHFIKAFRQTEGGTPHAYVLARRLDLALGLLLQANARVDWVAMQTGFSSPAHFVSTFRQHLGTTPGALRDAARVGR